MVTDGKDENNPGTAPGSQHTLDQVLSSLEGTDTTIYAIGLGEGADRQTLEKLAEASKGEAYFPADVVRARSGVQTHSREPAAPVRRELHLDEYGSRRLLAEGRDPADPPGSSPWKPAAATSRRKIPESQP